MMRRLHHRFPTLVTWTASSFAGGALAVLTEFVK